MRRLAAVLVLAGCTEDVFVFEGTPGTPTAANLDGLVPSVAARVNGVDAVFLLDTGAPMTILDLDSFPEPGEGAHDVDVEALGLSFPGYTTATWDLFGDGPESGGLDGIIGGDLLRHFAFTIDYQGWRVWLSAPFDRAIGGLAVEPSLDVGIRVSGGGLSLVPCSSGFCGTIDVPATRVLTRAVFEDQAEPVWVIVDSGASAVVLDEQFYETLGGDRKHRPHLGGVNVTTASGPADALLSRVWRLTLVGARTGDPEASVDNLPILVLPDSDLIDSIESEVGVDVRALVGGSFLREYATTFDYPERHLRLARYTDRGHIDDAEFIGMGFSFGLVGDDWVVADVWTGTDAEAEGLVEGDVIDEIAGMPITGQDGSVVGVLLAPFELGDEVPLTIRPGRAVFVRVEDLLPEYRR